MPKLLDHAKFCEDLPEVTSIKIMDKRKFHPEGLFSEQIFGPLRNYTCQCNKYYGVSKAGGKCDDCKVDIVNSDERRRRFAKIVLPIPAVNPIFHDLVVDLGGSDVQGTLDLLMKNEKSVMYKKGEDILATVHADKLPSDTRIYEKHEAIYEVVSGLAKNLAESGLESWKLVLDNIDKLFVKEVIVLPPDLRPAAKGVERNNQVVDKINRYYMQILTKKEIMRETHVDINRDKDLFYNYFKQLQRDVDELYEHIISKLSKKEGLIRGNILGKRIDFSGRGVIIPDPTLDLNECALPYFMFLELFKLQIAKKLIDLGRYRLLNNAIDFVDDCIDSKSLVLYKLSCELAEKEVCLLNRQPSLHRLSMIGFKIKISLTNVIKIHPLVCPGFNADFDGDQMAVYIPVTEEAKQEVKDKFLITKNFTNPANGSLTTIPSQDMVLGLYMLTTDKFPKLQKKVVCKGKTVNEGIAIFNSCLPEDYPVVTYSVGKKEITNILNEIQSLYDEETTMKVLDAVKRIGFKYSTLFGTSLSLAECQLPTARKIRESLYSSKDTRVQLAKVSSKETENLLKKNFNYSYMIESGARGSWDQVRQMILTRGFISNFGGQILPTPIKNSLLVGLTQEEFFNSTYGCRKGLLDVALNTGASGYLSRKLIFTCANLQINFDERDCGTTDFLEVHVNSKKKARMLMGKYYLKSPGSLGVISEDNLKELLGETIKIRSPIFCKSPEICCTCYGELYKILNSKFIGVVAAQSLGECNTQLILRTFHTSGVAVIKGAESEDMKQMDIVGDLASVSKALHQFKNKNYKSIVDELYEVYNISRSIHHVHLECVVSQLMWVGYRKWRLTPERDKRTPSYHSVQTVPSYESWLLGLAFSNPKRHILKGILYSGYYSGVMDSILCGDRVE